MYSYDRRVGREFSSPEALKKYLQKHPKADPSRHTVRQKGDKKKAPGGTGDGGAPGSKEKRQVEDKVEKALKKVDPKKRQEVVEDVFSALQRAVQQERHREKEQKRLSPKKENPEADKEMKRLQDSVGDAVKNVDPGTRKKVLNEALDAFEALVRQHRGN